MVKRFYSLLLLLFLIPVTHIKAQQGNAPQNLQAVVQTVGTDKKVSVELVSPDTDDIVIVITDSTGKTIYMENLHRYKGTFKRVVDMPIKGKYNVCVNGDGQKLKQTIDVK
jgi:hypothetical protein